MNKNQSEVIDRATKVQQDELILIPFKQFDKSLEGRNYRKKKKMMR